MKTRLFVITLFLSLMFTVSAQVPQGFNYQAVATTANGSPIANQTFKVRITLQTLQTGGTVVWQEEQTVTTNQAGLFSIVIGNGTQTGGQTVFKDIVWNNQSIYLKTEVNYPSAWTAMGAAKIWSVPYSLIADKALVADKANSITSGSKLEVVGQNDALAEALFVVRRKDGQPVFLVYPDSVRIWVPNSTTVKGSKGGFAIGGFSEAKSRPQELFRVTPDSVRIYLDPTPSTTKGSKGGFAIGGYTEAKGSVSKMYFNLSPSTTINTVMGSPQVLWYPQRNAFLAGNVRIASVDSVGDYSTAMGYWSRAAGAYSQAFGYKAFADGDYSTAIGKRSVAGVLGSKNNAFAFGNAAKALGSDSYAFGAGAEATGLRSFAFGSVGINETSQSTSTQTKASGDYSVAFGMGAQASAFGAMAFGANSTSSGYAATSLGFYSQASGYYGVAIGYYSKAQGSYGHSFGLASEASGTGALALGMYAKTAGNYAASMGYYSEAKNQYSVAVGYYAKAQADYSGAFGKSAIANGSNSIAIGNGATTGAAAVDATALGKLANATGATSMSLGISASSTGSNSIAIGNNAISNGNNSTTLGSNTVTSPTATYSTALGYGSKTGDGAEYATALGYNAEANGPKSISIGAYYNYYVRRLLYNPFTRRYTFSTVLVTKSNIASDEYSIAIGNGNTSNQGGLAIGSNNTARKIGAVALGHTATADSAYSIAAGNNTYARGYNAVAIGQNVTAEAANSFVIGYNNITNPAYSRDQWVDTDPLFVLGNGGTGTQSDAMVVYKNGTLKLPGLSAVSASGGYYLYATADGSIIRQTSSRKYKHDIFDINDYSWLYELRPVDFFYNTDAPGTRQYGFIAEDVDLVNKDLVIYKNGEPDGVNYMNMVAPLVKAVQDQKKTIDTLKSENDELKQRLEKLESLVNSLIKEQ